MNVPFEMDRRNLLGRIALLIGVTALPSGCLQADSGPSGSNFAFDKTQAATLAAFADTMIPKGKTIGALDVGVPKLFEGLMRNWASEETRGKIVDALARIDKAAKDAKGKGFAELDPAARGEVLTPIDAAGLKPAPAKPGEKKNPVFAGPSFTDAGYAKLRQLVIYLFYYSEPALTQELEYVHNPGRWDASVPVTKDTRQTGGLGMF